MRRPAKKQGSDRFTLRAMKPADYGAVLALWRKSRGLGLGESDMPRAIRAYLKRNPGLSLVAVSGRRLAGAVLCGHDGRRGYLHHLAVAAECRRRGVGRALVAGCLDRLRALGIFKCNIFLFTANTAGRAFWLREGWTGREDLLVMQKGAKPIGRGSC